MDPRQFRLGRLAPESPLQSLLLPADLAALQPAVLRALLGLTRRGAQSCVNVGVSLRGSKSNRDPAILGLLLCGSQILGLYSVPLIFGNSTLGVDLKYCFP